MQPRTMIWIGAAGLALAAIVVNERYFTLSTPREPRMRSFSADHLHNLSLAVNNYAGRDGLLPAAASTTATVPPQDLHGWQTYILPFLEEKPLYDQIDLHQSWTDPINEPHFHRDLEYYRNYAISTTTGPTGLALTHYSANSHVLTSVPLKLSDVTDGESNTLFSGEINARFPPWGQPRNVRDPADGLHTSPRSFGGPWSDRATQFGFLDGRVRAINPNIDPKVLRALATPAGGETVTPP